MQGTILRSEVWRQIHSGEPFDMIFITCDRRRRTGGELVTCEGWMVLSRDRESQAPAGATPPDPASAGAGITRDPNHEENGTVNVFNPGNSGVHPIRVHYDLIQFFNGKRVIN